METLLAQTWRLCPSGSVSLSCSSILVVRERDAEQRSAAVDISEQLCGTIPSVWHRWPSAKILGDIH